MTSCGTLREIDRGPNSYSILPTYELRWPEKILNQVVSKFLSTQKLGIIRKVRNVEISLYEGRMLLSLEVVFPKEFETYIPLENQTANLVEVEFKPDALPGKSDSFLRLSLFSLKVNGDEFIKVYEIASQVVNAILEDPAFKDFIIKREQVFFDPEVPQVTLQIDPRSFVSKTKMEEFKQWGFDLNQLRIWRFGVAPFWIPDPDRPGEQSHKVIPTFYLALSPGPSPAEYDLKMNNEILRESVFISENPKSAPRQVKQMGRVQEDLQELSLRVFSQFGVSPQSAQEQRDWENYFRKKKLDFEAAIDLNNKSFLAFPASLRARMLYHAEQNMVSYAQALKFNQDYDRESTLALRHAKGENSLPLTTIRLGQKALDAILGEVRSFELNKTRIFREVKVSIDPENSGLFVRGQVDLDSFGEQKFIEILKKPLNGFLPFEMRTRFSMGSRGQMLLRFVELAILDGDQKIMIRQNEKNGHVLFEIAYQFFVNHMGPWAVELSGDLPDIDLDPRPGLVTYRERFREKFLKITTQKEDVQPLNYLEVLKSYMEIDISRKPILEYRKPEAQIEATSLDKYLKKTRHGIEFALNPFLVLPLFTLPGKQRIQVWSFDPLHSPSLDRSFLEFSIGRGSISPNVAQSVLSRRKNLAQSLGKIEKEQDFEESLEGNPIDLSVKFSLLEMIDLLNLKLKEVSDGEKKVLEQKVSSGQDYNTQFLDQVRLSGLEADKIKIEGLWKIYEVKKGRLEDSFFTFKTIVRLDLVPTPKKLLQALPWSEAQKLTDMNLLKLNILQIEAGEQKGAFFYSKALQVFSLLPRYLRQFLITRFMKEPLESKQDSGNMRFAEIKWNRKLRFFVAENDIFMQLNPRVFSQSMDVNLIPVMTTQGDKLGFKIIPEENSIQFMASVAPAMAVTDRIKAYDLVSEMTQLMRTMNAIEDLRALRVFLEKSQIEELLLSNTEKSFGSRMIRLGEHYPDLLQFKELNEKPSKKYGGLYKYRLSDSGIELVYHLVVIRSHIRTLETLRSTLVKIDPKNNLISALSTKIQQIRKDWEERYIQLYASQFASGVDQAMKDGPTDWNAKNFGECVAAYYMSQVLNLELNAGQ